MHLPNDLEHIIWSFLLVPQYIKELPFQVSLYYRVKQGRILDPSGAYHPLF